MDSKKLNNERKYELVECDKAGFFQIKSLRDFNDVMIGELGGYIEKEENLSHNGDAWVYGDACVSGNAHVSGDALVYENAWVSGDAHVSGDACVSGNAHVSGDALVSGNACVSGNAHVSGDALVYENAWVSGDAHVSGDACVSVDARVYGKELNSSSPGIGVKDSQTTDKPAMEYLINDFILGMGYVLKYGEKKYGPRNWQMAPLSAADFEGARKRHAFKVGPDEDSGYDHLLHEACCCMMEWWHKKNKNG